mgnify:FL=1
MKGVRMDAVSVREVVERHRKKILGIPGVGGIAAARHPTRPDELCIVVYTTGPANPPGIPAELEGYDVVTEKGPGFRAL